MLAAAVWLIGAAILLWKGSSLLMQANALRPGGVWPWVALCGGLLLGGLKGSTLFRRSCARNLARIDALERPRPWQFFRPGFFGLLLLMILAGAALSRLAQGSYPLLIGVGWLDLSIATALIWSSRTYLNLDRPG